MNVGHAVNPVEVIAWYGHSFGWKSINTFSLSMQYALSQYSPDDRLCHDNFAQLGVPHMQLTGCVTPQYVAWWQRRRSKRLSRQHKLLSTDSFPQHRLWSMSSWAPSFPAFYTIIVYVHHNPLLCWIVIQSKSWFHTSQIRNRLLHNNHLFFKDIQESTQ